MKKILSIGALSAFALIVSISACKKEEEADTDTQAASDNEQAEFVSNDALTKTDAATKGQSSFKLAADPQLACATVTRNIDSTGTGTSSVTIDFGPTNVTCTDGRERRGKILMSWTGNYYTAGSARTITFDNYYVSNFKVEGTHVVTFNGLSQATQNYTWTVNARDMKVTRPDGKFHTWTSTRTREMMEGDSTIFNFTDDVYHITGSANGTNVNGVAYTVTIDSPLKVALTCKYIMSGKLTLTPSGHAARTVDFGTGACDNQATVTINNQSYPITLH